MATVSAPITVNPRDLTEVGQNVKCARVGDLLVIVVDIKKDLGLSKTGKMSTVANTSGFTALHGALRGNIYIGTRNAG